MNGGGGVLGFILLNGGGGVLCLILLNGGGGVLGLILLNGGGGVLGLILLNGGGVKWATGSKSDLCFHLVCLVLHFLCSSLSCGMIIFPTPSPLCYCERYSLYFFTPSSK